MALRITHALQLFALIWLGGTVAHAQQSVKESIFENCDDARRAFIALPAPEQRQTFDFLTRIVALNTQTPTSPEVFPVIPGQPSGPHLGPALGRDSSPGHMWQATDAKRELRAKRCALELFLAAGAQSLPALPDLIAVYSKQNLSDEVAVALEETSANVAETAHRAGMLPTEADIDGVARHLQSDHPLLAQNFLSEFPIVSTPRVVRALAEAPEESRGIITSTLHQLDPEGSRTVRAFLDMARTLSSAEVSALSLRLPLPSSPEILQPYAVDIIRLAADPTYTASTTSLLGRTCVALKDLLIEPAAAAEIAQRIDIHREGLLSHAEQVCILKALPALATRTALEITSTDEAIVLRTLPLIPSAAPHLIGENRATVFNRLKDLVLANNPLVSPQALQALGVFVDKRSDVITAVLNVLSSATLKGYTANAASPLYATALKTASSLGLGKESSRFSPVIISAVNSGFAFDEARTLAKGHPTIEAELLKLIPRGSADVTSRALTILGDRPSLSAKAVPVLIEVLRAGAHNASVFTALSRVGPSASSAVRKTLAKGSSPRRVTALSLLVIFNSASKQEASELISLLSSPNCGPIPTEPRVLISLQTRKDIDPSSASAMLAAIGGCVSTLDNDNAVRLLEGVPALIPLSCNHATERLTAAQLSDRVALTLTEQFLRASVCPSYIAKALLHEEQPLRTAAIKHLQGSSSLDEVVLKAASEALNDMDSTSELYFDYATVLAKLAPQMYNWKDLIRDAIVAAGKNQPIDRALEVIRFLPPSTVLEEVTPALNSESPERVVGGCHVGAALGAQAVPIVSKLWNLRDKRHPSIRYAASLALLEINPLTPELQDALRQILVNRYFAWALTRPVRWQQTVALIELPKAEFGTLRTVHLERLITSKAARSLPPRAAQ